MPLKSATSRIEVFQGYEAIRADFCRSGLFKPTCEVIVIGLWTGFRRPLKIKKPIDIYLKFVKKEFICK